MDIQVLIFAYHLVTTIYHFSSKTLASMENFSNKWIYMKHIKAIGRKFKKSMFCTE